MFKKMNKKLFLIILASVFAGIVLAVITNQGVSATTQTSFCLTCHDAPEFSELREARPHAKIDCLSCHGEGFTQDKINGVGHLFSTITGRHDPNNYLDIKTEVPNDKCLTCHNIDNIERERSVLLNHKDFISDGNSCTSGGCHNVEFMHGELGDYSSGYLKDDLED